MSLVDELRDYTNLSHANAWRLAKLFKGPSGVPDEPAIVSSLLSHEMFRGMRAILQKYKTPGVNALTRGIFTHQTPKVLLTGHRQSVEIADLMFVHQHFHTDPRKPVRGSALLLQAKNTLKPKTGSLASGTQAIQFELYRDWAPFTGKTRLAKYATGTSPWDFNSGVGGGSIPATSGSAYFTVFKEEAYSAVASVPHPAPSLQNGPSHHKLLKYKYPSACTWAVGASPVSGTTPKSGVNCPSDFGMAFSDFLQGKIGRSFVPGQLSGPDHWSIFVNSMLAESAKANGSYTYGSSNQGKSSAARGRNLGFLALETAFRHSFAAETEEFLDSVADSLPLPNYPITNHFYRALVDSDSGGHREMPPNESSQVWRSGHVPILLVITVGDDHPFLQM